MTQMVNQVYQVLKTWKYVKLQKKEVWANKVLNIYVLERIHK